ncbi:hypothetical protein BGZ57DRAFT_779476, partial [Hyaloscypha finlandica]
TTKRRFIIESEIIIIKYFVNITYILISKIFGYIISIDRNPIKLPYILIEYIRGNILFDLGGPSILTIE